jgi:hypothetical protein
MNHNNLFFSQGTTPDGARLAAKVPRFQKLMLKAFLLLQAVHSIFFFAMSTTQFVLQDFSFGIWGWKLERLGAALISMVLVILLLRETFADKRRAWGLTLMLVIDVACYGFWAWTDEAPLFRIMLTAQLALMPFVIVALLKTMRNCGVTTVDFCAAASAVVIAALVVFVRGRYYPANSPNWYPLPPLYYRLLTFSDFHWPQEKSLALLMATFLTLSWIFQKATRTSKKS